MRPIPFHGKLSRGPLWALHSERQVNQVRGKDLLCENALKILAMSSDVFLQESQESCWNGLRTLRQELGAEFASKDVRRPFRLRQTLPVR